MKFIGKIIEEVFPPLLETEVPYEYKLAAEKCESWHAEQIEYNVGIYRNTTGATGKFLEVNPALVQMFGYESKEEFFTLSIADLYRDRNDRLVFNKKMLKEGSVKDEQIQLKKKHGTFFIGSVSAVVVKDNKGNVKYYDGIIEDITERLQAKEIARESERRYKTLFEHSSDGVFIINLDDNIVTVNNRGAEILGY